MNPEQVLKYGAIAGAVWLALGYIFKLNPGPVLAMAAPLTNAVVAQPITAYRA